MTWAILLVFLVMMGVVTLSGRRRVSWASKLRRIQPGVSNQARWSAPDEVIQIVHDDYLNAVRCLAETVFKEWSEQWLSAPLYLSGLYLKRHQEILKLYQLGKHPRYIGVLRCLHKVEVSHFSDDGERCLILDTQTRRQIMTFDAWSEDYLTSQAFDDRVCVYEMRYDRQICRWKLDRFIQELPLGWQKIQNSKTHRIHLLSSFPPGIGRDN